MGRTVQNGVSIYINDDLLSSVDRLAVSLGKSRAATIKWILSQFQPGMDLISDSIENIETNKSQEVSSLMRVLAEAAALVGQKSFDLAVEQEYSDHVGND